MWPVTRDPYAHREPVVPTDLIRYTCGHEDYEAYLLSGFEVASMLNLALRKSFRRLVSDYESVLDFGCGAGRLSRHLNPAGALSGCDVNQSVATYCESTIGHGSFYANGLMPPLRYADGHFDLVCSFSVFSHLRLDVEQVWLAELARVGRAGCAYLITVQGDWMIDMTLGAEADAARAQGFSYRKVHQRHRSPLDFPD